MLKKIPNDKKSPFPRIRIYYEKQWTYITILFIFELIFFPFSLWFCFYFDDVLGAHDPMMDIVGYVLLFVELMMIVLMIIILLNKPYSFRIDSKSIQVNYLYSLIKREYFFRDIEKILYYRSEVYIDALTTGETIILLMKIGDSYGKIESVPNQIIKYLYDYVKREKIREIGDPEARELSKSIKIKK